MSVEEVALRAVHVPGDFPAPRLAAGGGGDRLAIDVVERLGRVPRIIEPEAGDWPGVASRAGTLIPRVRSAILNRKLGALAE